MKLLPLGLYYVKGASMLPTFKSGSILLGSRWWPKPKAGHIAVIKKDKRYIKRLTKHSQQGYWAEGDNTASSTDSRQFGWIKPAEIEAVIVLKLW